MRLTSSILLSSILALAVGPAVSGCRKAANPAAGGGGGGGFAVRVVAVPAKEQPVVETVSLVGSVVPNEMIDVKCEIDGPVKQIGFDEGQRVEKGQLLVLLDESKLAASLAEADANMRLAKTSFERTADLYRSKLISQQDYDQASATFSANEASVDLKRRMLSDARVVAPFSGIAGARQVSPGQVISRNTLITTLVDLDTVKVEVSVPERYLSQVQVGLGVGFKVAAFPGETFKGEVYFISPQLDAGTRTALVKARIANPGGRLRGGMFANLDLALELRKLALVIPEPAIMNNGDTTMVFTVNAQNKAEMKPVKVGLRLAGRAEILSGLTAGDRVVVEGVQKLRPGAPVEIAGAEATAPYTK